MRKICRRVRKYGFHLENWENAIFSAPPLWEMALALQACQQTPQKLFSEPFANINSDQGGKKSEKLPPGREFPIGSKKKSLFNQIGHSIPPLSTFWWIFRTRRFGQKFYYDCSSTCISTLYVEVEPFSLVLIQFQADINNLIIFDTLISTFNTVDGDAV